MTVLMLVCRVELQTPPGLGLETPAIFILAKVKRVVFSLHRPSVQLCQVLATVYSLCSATPPVAMC